MKIIDSYSAKETYQIGEEIGKNAKPGSIAAKANMVREYNEKNNK